MKKKISWDNMTLYYYLKLKRDNAISLLSNRDQKIIKQWIEEGESEPLVDCCKTKINKEILEEIQFCADGMESLRELYNIKHILYNDIFSY